GGGVGGSRIAGGLEKQFSAAKEPAGACFKERGQPCPRIAKGDSRTRLSALRIDSMVALLRPFARQAAEEEVGIHHPVPLDIHGPPALEEIFVAQPKVGVFGHVDAPGLSQSFHAAGDIDRIAPKIEDEFLPPDTS